MEAFPDMSGGHKDNSHNDTIRWLKLCNLTLCSSLSVELVNKCPISSWPTLLCYRLDSGLGLSSCIGSRVVWLGRSSTGTWPGTPYLGGSTRDKGRARSRQWWSSSVRSSVTESMRRACPRRCPRHRWSSGRKCPSRSRRTSRTPRPCVESTGSVGHTSSRTEALLAGHTLSTCTDHRTRICWSVCPLLKASCCLELLLCLCTLCSGVSAPRNQLVLAGFWLFRCCSPGCREAADPKNRSLRWCGCCSGSAPHWKTETHPLLKRWEHLHSLGESLNAGCGGCWTSLPRSLAVHWSLNPLM